MQLLQKNNLGDRTEYAKRSIIRYIIEKGLIAGDKLPTQAELRQKLQLGNATITRAVQSLAAERIVEIQPKIGVFLKHSNADGYKGWTIGIAVPELTKHPFSICLLLYVQRCLHKFGCQSTIFYGQETFQNTGFDLEWFPGLQRSIAAHRIDGLITFLEFTEDGWNLLRQNNIPVSFIGPIDVPCNSVYYDIASFTQKVVLKALNKGSQRPALLVASGIVRNLFFPVFTETTKPLANFCPEKYYFDGLPQSETGSRIAEHLMAMPEHERPDTIISLDDNITIGLTSTLVASQWDRLQYKPPIITLCNRQIPIMPPWPDIDYYEVNIENMADKAVELCLKQLKQKNIEKEVILLQPVNKKEEN